MAENARMPYSSQTEKPDPATLRIDGTIPSWLNGRLVRVGPGLFHFGKHEAVYPMDGMGLLHSFHIQDGQATFQSKYISSDALKKNQAAERYVAAEFGTAASPDPTKSTFAKLKDKVTGGGDLSDNCTHNLCYWKQNNVLLVIGLPFFVIDPKTLETVDKIKLPESLGIDLVTEHVQIDKDGTLYLLGSHVRGKPTYNIVKVPATGDVKSSFAAAEIVFTVNGQYKVTPTSHHNFLMTDNYFVLIENPMEINILKILTKATALEALTWDPSVTSKFHVYNRTTKQRIKHKIESDSFYFLHSPNAYEDNNHLVLDMFIFNRFTVKELFIQRMQLASPDYAIKKPWKSMDINRPVRFVIPTKTEDIEGGKLGDNLVRLADEAAEVIVEKSRLRLNSRPLTKQGEDVLQYPCINSALRAQPYTYFYAGGYGESEFLQFGLGKFDVKTKEVTTWEAKTNQYLTEPVFIPNPEGVDEDDGILLLTMLDYAEGNDRLVVLDAKSMSPLAQIYFTDKSTGILPEADHGVFIPA